MIQTTENSGGPARRRVSTLGGGVAVAVCALALAGTVRAQTPSGNIGDASSQPSGAGNGAGIVNPSGSTSQYLVTTLSSNATHDGTSVSGTSAVPVATLANFAYLSPSSVAYNSSNPGTEGSAYEFTLTVTSTANSVLKFTYNFATAENVGGNENPDFAFLSVTPVNSNGLALGATSYGLLGSAGDAAGGFSVINDPNGNSPFSYTEGYKTGYTGQLAVGRYVLALGVADANTYDTGSGLYIGSVSQVPEPGTTATLALAGLLGGACLFRRRAQSAA